MKNEYSADRHNLSRRDFLKGTAAGALSIAAVGVLGACASDTGATTAAAETTTAAATTAVETTAAAATAAANTASGIYTPGTYSATAKGMGQVTVTMTFDAESITDVQIDVSNETPDIGGKYGEELAEKILSSQSAEITETYTADVVVIGGGHAGTQLNFSRVGDLGHMIWKPL